MPDLSPSPRTASAISPDTGLARLHGWRRLEFEGSPIYVLPQSPDWVLPNRRADGILGDLLAGRTTADVVTRYRERWGAGEDLAWDDVRRTLERLPARLPEVRKPRAGALQLDRLRECWLHVTNRCNLACTHCMFASSPRERLELGTDRLLALTREARDLGCRLFYLTGGEPLVHPGFATLCRAILEDPEAHVVILTNTLAVSRQEEALRLMPRERVHFQVSLDCPGDHHDAVRGEGCYDRVLERTRRLVGLGFPVAFAMAVDGRNAHHMPDLVEEAAANGVASVHYLWHFVRGGGKAIPWAPVGAVFSGLRAAHALGQRLGVAVDNVAIAASQVFSLPGTRHDLSNAGWESLAVGPDDRIYPTAAMVLDDRVACGPVGAPLGEVWRNSPVLESLRGASVAGVSLDADPLAYLTGGGDVDHSFFAGGAFIGHDPYRELADRVALWLIAAEAGPDGPRAGLRARMGERVDHCGESAQALAFTHSNCVLSLPGRDGHTLVRDFYAAAAARPRADIANPVDFGTEAAAAPAEARTRSYGCGSPVLDADPKPGETLVDLGCGAGLECAIAARKVGRQGRVIGVDMLDDMLALARATAGHVARELGYDVFEPRRGFLETIPCEDSLADVVISNCVINLSVNKRRTFEEILRVLKPGGRLVVADVVADEEPPLAIRTSERLRGECLGGALLQADLFRMLEDCGFGAITLLKRYPYRTVAGHAFYSVTCRAERPRPTGEARVVYRGPYAAVITDEGRVLRRGIPAPAPAPGPSPADPVFVLDEEGGVANVDLAGGCACFVAPPPAPAAATRVTLSVMPAPPIPGKKVTDREGCMVCGARLEYSTVAEPAACHYCGRGVPTSARCAAGHFVCDGCHAEDAVAVIRAVCEAATETDMVALLRRIRRHPAVPVHGPEHHALVPAVIVAAARNAGLPLDNSHLETAITRGRTVAGGACGFMGACGAAVGAGVGFAVILGSNPYLGARRQAVQQLTARALGRIASLEAARCCQRDCWLALQEASASSEDLLGVRLPAAAPLPCAQHAGNKECAVEGCPLWPSPLEPSSRLLPMM